MTNILRKVSEVGNFNLENISARKPDRFIIAWMILVHLIAFSAPFVFSVGAFVTFLILYFVTACLGITFGFHRLLTHRSLKATPWFERFLATCGTLALQGSPMEWVAHHRMHHAGSDTPRDPHNAKNGFWYSHITWLFHQDPAFDDPNVIRKFSRDISADPYMVWLSKPLTMVGMQVILGLLLLVVGGWEYVVWGIFARIAFVYHVTWFVNSASHMWGYRNYETKDLTTNCWWVGILAFGEGWHNNHHAEQEAVHVSRKWWEFDATWQVIKLARGLGLVSNLKMPKDPFLQESTLVEDTRNPVKTCVSTKS